MYTEVVLVTYIVQFLLFL